MTRTQVLQEIRQMRFAEAYGGVAGASSAWLATATNCSRSPLCQHARDTGAPWN